jgi:hypothetical protein
MRTRTLRSRADPSHRRAGIASFGACRRRFRVSGQSSYRWGLRASCGVRSRLPAREPTHDPSRLASVGSRPSPRGGPSPQHRRRVPGRRSPTRPPPGVRRRRASGKPWRTGNAMPCAVFHTDHAIQAGSPARLIDGTPLCRWAAVVRRHRPKAAPVLQERNVWMPSWL